MRACLSVLCSEWQYFYSSCIAINMTCQWEQLSHLRAVLPQDLTLSHAASVCPKTDQEQQRKLFQSFPSFWSRAAQPGTQSDSDVLLWWFPGLGELCCELTYWQTCFSHLSGRRTGSCCERSECTVAAEDHSGTSGSGKEGFRTRWGACGGNQALNHAFLLLPEERFII